MAKKPNNRDDFSEPTKRLLEKQAASRCCNPGCGQPTRAASWDGSKSINIGTAAHIHAAAEGGARFDPDMTSEERKSPENGIWMCRNCGTLIDTDEAGFPADEIRRWKKEAIEERRQEIIAPAKRLHHLPPEQHSASPTEQDIERYKQIIEELPTDGSTVCKLVDFNAGWPFDKDWINELLNFARKWTSPERAFTNPVVQNALVQFTKAISSFHTYMSVETFPLENNSYRNSVPEEWQITQPEKYRDTINSLNTLADEVQGAHTNLIQVAKKELQL